MLTDPATNAAFRINLRTLQSDLNFKGCSGRQWGFPGALFRTLLTVLTVCADQAASRLRVTRLQQIVVARGKLTRA